MNINKIIQGKQKRLFGMILLGMTVVVGGLWLVNKKVGEVTSAEDKAVAEASIPEPDVDLTGAMTNTFDGNVRGNAIIDAQMRERQAAKALDEAKGMLKKLEGQLDDISGENAGLKAQMSKLESQLLALQNAGPGNAGTRTTPAPQTAYRLSPPPVRRGQIDNAEFDYRAVDAARRKPSSAFYVPTGTFSNAIVIEGADANASVRGQQKLVPMMFKLTGLAHLPGNQRLDKLENCFVTAAAYGEISSERAAALVQRLSCIIDGKHIDQEVKGHATFYGKNGIKGVPVMRNGKILGLAFGAGALSGIGQSVSQVGQTVTGIGATSSISGGDVARGAIGGGASTAANKLADYYIERAEQYHPIIPIGAANRIEIVFTEGFKAEFLEDNEEAAERANAKAVQQKPVQDPAFNPAGDSGLPPELLGQLGDAQSLELSDFVTPAAPTAPSQGG